MFMPTTVAGKVANAMRKTLQHYTWLRAHNQDNMRFPIRPKFHWCYHIGEFARFQNPRTQWTYKNEDWVGQLATLAHNVSHGTRPNKLAQSLHTKARLMLHSRLMQSWTE